MLEEIYRQLACDLMRQFHSLGWTTGTGGAMGILNQETNRIIMTPSAVQKERLHPSNVFVLDKNGNIIEQGKPTEHQIRYEHIPKTIRVSSCCSSIMQHFQLYPEKTGCVIHTHSMKANLVSLLFKGYDEIIIKDLHMIRAIKGYNSDDISKIIIPIIPNEKRESDLVMPIRNALIKYPNSFAILIRSHGIYVYGKDWRQAKIHCEAFEYLFEQVLFLEKIKSRKQLAQLVIGNNSNSNGNIGGGGGDRKSGDYTSHKEYPLFLYKNHPFITSSRLKNKDNVVAMLKSLNWNDKNNSVLLIDQKKLPGEFDTVECKTYIEMGKEIKNMTIRGAPAIGVAGAYGMVLAAKEFASNNDSNDGNDLVKFEAFMTQAKAYLDASRPTAVNLVWATNRMEEIIGRCIGGIGGISINRNTRSSNVVNNIISILLNEANEIFLDDINTNVNIGEYGNYLIKPNYRIMHHCNTGSLATACGGTALGVIYKSFYDNKNIFVYVNETRPRLQGSRLTSFELSHQGIEHKIVVDGCCAHLMSNNKVDCVIVGCDRVAINGDTANKIGTQTVAMIAKQFGVPMYVACPVQTIDVKCKTGKDIIIEERSMNEIKKIGNFDIVCNDNTQCYNPAFDVSDNKYITAFITQYGICYPPFEKSLMGVVNKYKNDVEKKSNQRIDKYVRQISASLKHRAKL